MSRNSVLNILAITFVTLLMGAFNNCTGKFQSVQSSANSSAQTGTPPPPTPQPPPPQSGPFPVVDVAVGNGGMRVSSIDGGKNWKYTSDAVPANDCWAYRGVTYGNGLWVAVSQTGGFGRISTSSNGVHWRHVEGYGGDCVAYGNGKFINENFTSTDGYNFTRRVPNYNPGGHASCTFSNGKFFISGDSLGIAASADGDNFTVTLPDHSGLTQDPTIKGWASGNGIIVGIGIWRVVTSGDGGQTWTDHDDFFGYGKGPGNSYFTTILFDGTQFVISGHTYEDGGETWKSSDGIHWTMAPSPAAGTDGVIASGGLASSHLFGFNSFLYDHIFYSMDLGATWTAATSLALSSFYDFSTVANPVANPPLSTFSGFWLGATASGVPSADPNVVPTMPPSLLYNHADILNACGPDLPPGR